MQNLKINVFLLLFCVLVSACQSTRVFGLKTFHVSNRDRADDLHVIHVNSNRVRQKCLFFNAEAENKWRHQYIMYILNDRGETLEIIQPTNQDQASCYAQAQKIERILHLDSRVKICARDKLKKTIQNHGNQDKIIQFGALGNHRITYEALTLDSICNSKECLRNNDIWVDTCPGFLKQ